MTTQRLQESHHKIFIITNLIRHLAPLAPLNSNLLILLIFIFIYLLIINKCKQTKAKAAQSSEPAARRESGYEKDQKACLRKHCGAKGQCRVIWGSNKSNGKSC